MKDFIAGLFSIFESLKFIKKNKDLWFWILCPFLIYMSLLFYSFSWGVGLIESYTIKALNTLKSIGLEFLVDYLHIPLVIILSLAFGVLLIYLIFVFGSIFASPFNAVLAEKTLLKTGLIEDRPFNFMRWTRVTIKMMLASVLKSILFLFFGVFIFIASFIPGLNILSIYFTLMIMAFDSMDYSYELMELNLGRRIMMFRSSWWTASGLATSFGLTLVLPGVILLFLPVSVVSAGLLMQSQVKSNPRLFSKKG